MATPRPHAPMGGGGWHGPSQTMPAAPNLNLNPNPASAPTPGQHHCVEEPGLQVRPMGLKVHYTFDKDAKVNCLARYPHTLHVQTIPIDETSAIGVVDLRACLHAVIECSPELASQDCDYTIYAVDYSESNTPLVGQGMLSWALEALRGDVIAQQSKMVTGRVTKNLLAVFGGGNRETLEVKLKLSVSAKGVQRHHHHDSMNIQQSRPMERSMDQQIGQQMNQHMNQHMDRPVERQMDHHMQHMDRPMEMAMTPTGTSEWNSFIQSNPHFGHTGQVVRVASPALAQGMSRGMSQDLSQGSPAMANTQDSFGQPAAQQSMPPTAQEVQRVAPTPVEPSEPSNTAATSSRPSSRASNRAPRKKPPTGRPRGRPRKRPADGNTSGYEDVTEGEEAPNKKRAKPTKVDNKSAPNPFSAAAPESLRVAASTSGSLRNFRPVGANNEAVPGNHLQEIPRAPTPVPEGGPFAGLPGRGPNSSKLRRESTLSQQHAAAASYSDLRLQPLSPDQEDGRSPESIAPTPAAYSEGTLADIGSSPPVQRTTPFMRSSPPPSSPVLPPMPHAELRHHDSSFANDEMDDLFGEEPSRPAPTETLPTRAPLDKSTKPRTVSGVPIQVFQMQDGPMGQDMVWLRSLNGAPHPASVPPAPGLPSQPPPQMSFQMPPQMQSQMPAQAPAQTPAQTPSQAPPRPQPPSSDAPTLPPLKKDPPRPKRARPPPKKKAKTAPRCLAPAPVPPPTPPPTTDSVDKPMSPAPAIEAVQDNAQLSPGQLAAEPMQGVVQHSPPKPSPEPVTTTEAPTQEAGQDQPTTKQPPEKRAPQRKAPQNSKPRNPRPLGRSQSAGAVPLALPAVPASEPAGPSSLSQSTVAEPDRPTPPAPSALKRAASSGPLALPVPASDPVRPLSSAPQAPGQVHRETSVPASDAIPPASSPPASKSNKNIVKKHAIKQRLDNCGAIETPTWRKIWVQDHEGEPEHYEYSEKPGRVTAVDILKRDAEDKPTSYRLIKKSLGPADDKAEWEELLLCNPCGIWLTKYRVQRPPDRWDKDFSRIGQERRRKGTGRSESRSKKSRSKSDAVNPTSEAYLPTDALGPVEPSSPKMAQGGPSQADLARPQSQQNQEELETRGQSVDTSSGNNETGSNPGSTHSRGSGSANSPMELDFDEAVGSTKRLLFPSPRKDGVPKVLGEVDVNMVQISNEFQHLKRLAGLEKEGSTAATVKTAVATTVENGQVATMEHDDLEALFQSPSVGRPSTPPPNAMVDAPTGLFETPTRPTPNHRPITRSVSRSMRSATSMLSPGQALLRALVHQTPTKTPRAAFGVQGSVGPRRSPRNHDGTFDVFDTPISRSISTHLYSDATLNFTANEFTAQERQLGLAADGFIDFGNLLSGEGGMPRSPPGGDRTVRFDYHGSANIWGDWTMENTPDDNGGR
ncbi:hypothetical protein TOPH_01610 [Tolypocladium ophioglossoides CBS 100239]|uniref:Ams2/SPT21 N-terminal domain-containing protein n=1 Tax=Tolypocladium ophioglossoides (strain CBS 100239) TaxID=1163406 RepID=A0A0L0NJS6_TOLOC|nr:hypothetical protein TOPH_01610 [Tolypocladium ophioglossoides CBS 100239]